MQSRGDHEVVVGRDGREHHVARMAEGSRGVQDRSSSIERFLRRGDVGELQSRSEGQESNQSGPHCSVESSEDEVRIEKSSRAIVAKGDNAI